MFSLPSMFMSMSTSISEEGSVSNETRVHDCSSLNSLSASIGNPLAMQQHEQPQGSQQLAKTKKKRSNPGHPDPDSEVVALSPKTLMASNRFVCEICNKGFQRDQNLQLHRRGHNLPWKLRQKSGKGVVKKKVYVCPEPSCVHHHPSRALGDLTGIKKHFSRKHGEKKWKCDKCSKRYAVQSDWKAHVKACGTREYRCDCGTLFSRKDSFTTHRAFCDALAEEGVKLTAAAATTTSSLLSSTPPSLPCHVPFTAAIPNAASNPGINITSDHLLNSLSISFNHDDVSASLYRFPTTGATPHLSATALLRRACSLGPMSANMSYAVEALERNTYPAPADLDVGEACDVANGGRRWASEHDRVGGRH